LALNRSIEVPELRLHIYDTPTANGAFVRGVHMVIVTLVVYTMPTRHENDSQCGGKHILSANGTVAVSGTLNTTMRVCYRH
jgi:hypothetical protein